MIYHYVDMNVEIPVQHDSCLVLLLCLQVSTALTGCWSWAWVIRLSWAVGRASTRWSWRSRKPSCASWQPFWKATVLSYDLSPRHPPRKPRTPARFLTCKVSGNMSVWPIVTNTLKPFIMAIAFESDSPIRVTEEMGWTDKPSCSFPQQPPQTPNTQTHKTSPLLTESWVNFFPLKEFFLNDSHQNVCWLQVVQTFLMPVISNHVQGQLVRC